MAINYSVEYPLALRKITELKAENQRLRDALKETTTALEYFYDCGYSRHRCEQLLISIKEQALKEMSDG